MTPEKWQQVQDLFDHAVELAPADRDPWLSEACDGDAELLAEIRSLLAHDGTRGSGGIAAPVRVAALEFEGRQIPRRLGPYELLEQIGRGGMGTVFKAQRVDEEYHTTVAIKLVRPGMDTDFVLSRFRRERQTLARLSHPNIARLLDGGTSDTGIPYIVMEYISGVWISDYVRSQNLSIKDRLRLMLPICHAVDYAHRQFVIHRDIKPGNILIDHSGAPKLLDFGICKLLHADPLEPMETLTQGIGMMTPDYASPEQVMGEAISPSSDVFSLAVVIYELLVGKRAHRVEKYTPLGVEDAICRKPVALPSDAADSPALASQLRGDLDNILMRALQKEPARRYESAAALAQDLERYLTDMPVLAQADTYFYRARKFLKRNWQLAAAVGAVLVALGIGAGVVVYQARLARQQERVSRELARDGLFQVYDSIRDLPGATDARQKIIASVSGYLETLAAANPTDTTVLSEIAEGYRRIGDMQGSNGAEGSLGNPAVASASYARAIEHLDKILAAEPRNVDALKERVRLLRRVGDLDLLTQGADKALASYATAVAAARQLLSLFPGDHETTSLLATVLLAMGRRQRETGDLTNSAASTDEALRLFTELSTKSPIDTELLASVSSAEADAGMTAGQLGQLDAALAHYQSSVEHNKKALELQPDNVTLRRSLMTAYRRVGDVLGNTAAANLGRQADAEKPFREMLRVAESLKDADAEDARAVTDHAIAGYRLASVLPPRSPEKRTLLDSSRDVFQQQLATSPGDLTLAMNLAFVESFLGDVSRDAGAPETRQHYTESMRFAERLLPNENAAWALVRSGIELAKIEARSGKGTSAIALLDRIAPVAQEGAERVDTVAEDASGGRALVARLYSGYVAVYFQNGDVAHARQWQQKARVAWADASSKAWFDPHLRQEMEAFEAAYP